MAVAIAEVSAQLASRVKTQRGIELGVQLENIRRELGWTQRHLAELLDMSEEGYRNYAKGYGRITRDTLPRWSNAFGMTLADLASRLKIDLLAEPDASNLRQQVAALMPDADAAEVDDLVRRLATLPPTDRRQVLDGWRDNLTGRIARLGRA